MRPSFVLFDPHLDTQHYSMTAPPGHFEQRINQKADYAVSSYLWHHSLSILIYSLSKCCREFLQNFHLRNTIMSSNDISLCIPCWEVCFLFMTASLHCACLEYFPHGICSQCLSRIRVTANPQNLAVYSRKRRIFLRLVDYYLLWCSCRFALSVG